MYGGGGGVNRLRRGLWSGVQLRAAVSWANCNYDMAITQGISNSAEVPLSMRSYSYCDPNHILIILSMSLVYHSVWNKNHVSMATHVNKNTHLGPETIFLRSKYGSFTPKIKYIL